MTDPKFDINSIVNGKNYGQFVVFGRRFSETVSEWIYAVCQVDNEQNIISREMNMVESCFDYA